MKNKGKYIKSHLVKWEALRRDLPFNIENIFLKLCQENKLYTEQHKLLNVRSEIMTAWKEMGTNKLCTLEGVFTYYRLFSFYLLNLIRS